VDDPEPVGDQELHVVHALDLRSLHVDDLLVEEEAADQEFMAFRFQFADRLGVDHQWIAGADVLPPEGREGGEASLAA
jgi:hypothetical protein